MKRLERQWMYERLDERKKPRSEYATGVREFLEFAQQSSVYKDLGEMRCPCKKCKNAAYRGIRDVQSHLWSNGFVDNYYVWTHHGENLAIERSTSSVVSENPYRELVENALRDNVEQIMEERLNPDDITEEEVRFETPNPQVSSFFRMLDKAEQPVFEGSPMSLLQAAARLLALKCEGNLSLRSVNGYMSFVSDMIPKENQMLRNFQEIKNVLKGLQLPHEKIDACPTGCMLFWEENADLEECTKCHESRYKSAKNSSGRKIPCNPLTYFPLAPRLQRLYATKHIAGEMSWHHKNSRLRESGTMAHPSDGEAWKHFDREHPEFACEPRNVRLGLCTDGFDPFGSFSKPYSCWPVILTPYNLPPWLCMKRQFMFLSLIVPGPKSPKANLDVYLQPLIKELKELWETGVSTYDVSRKQNFQLKVALMWTINDFPAYGMLSGWSTSGYRACPYCPEKDHRSFWLKRSCKVSWFDCHREFLKPDHPFRNNCKHFLKNRKTENRIARPKLTGDEVWNSVKDLPKIVDASNQDLKRLKDKKEGWWKQSIFWELPYWKTLLIRHNLDVMHIEKNVFEHLFDTVMDVPKKTKFGPKGKADFLELCLKRPTSSRFVLTTAEKKALCEWVSSLKFPDGYASDLSRCVDHEKLLLHSMKSHDCHVFMERLLPVALKHLLPTCSWNAITEISQFFRDLCTSTIKVETMERLESDIPEIICKLEKIFPPSLFNSMEHLPIHLPYEAKVGGPVQYRWMYPFERFLNHLKKKISNKARVEGSICNAYLLEEISNFCSLYFEDHIDTKAKDLDVGMNLDDHLNSNLPELFNTNMGSTTGKCRERFLDEKEFEEAHFYVLRNCGKLLKRYEEDFEIHIKLTNPDVVSSDDVWSKHDKSFTKWFRSQADRLEDPFIQTLAMGPSNWVRTWRRYSINGYKFRAYKENVDVPKATLSNGVCVSSTEGLEYYGTLNEVIELAYYTDQRIYRIVLFKCNWFDNSSQGLNIHKVYGLVDVNQTKKLRGHNPFVLAYQVDQVCYAPYPTTKKGNQWSAVFKIKARSFVDAPVEDIVFQEDVGSDRYVSPIVVEDIGNAHDEYDVVVLSGEEDEDNEEEEENEEDQGENNEEEEPEVGLIFSDDEARIILSDNSSDSDGD